MARGINKVILIGNLGADPETRAMPSGTTVANLRIATSESWRDKQTGEQQERTEWHRVAFFGRLAEVAGEYLRKGSQVYVEGSLRTRKWQDKQGNDRYSTEIVGNDLQMLGGRAGGAAGAAPPVLGWAAVTNNVDPHALLLFLIIFTWTPPHFWALAIARREEYAKVGIPMLPVTHGIPYTRLQIVLYTILLVLSTLLPYLTGMSGFIYLGIAVALNGRFLYYALTLRRGLRPELPMRTFRFSITYLMLLFAALILDHYFLFRA